MSDNSVAVSDVRLEDRRRDLFEGLDDLQGIFTGVADYLSLWADRYGLRMDDLKATRPAFNNPVILSFKVQRRSDDEPVSPVRYDTRLAGANAFRNRFWRLRRYLAHCTWLRRTMREVDDLVRAWLHDHGLKASDVEAVSRWDGTGRVIIKFIPKGAAANSRRYQTHRKYDDL